jgi:hypothetical protein
VREEVHASSGEKRKERREEAHLTHVRGRFGHGKINQSIVPLYIMSFTILINGYKKI